LKSACSCGSIEGVRVRGKRHVPTVADLGEGPEGCKGPPFFILGKKKKSQKKSQQGKQNKTAPSPLAQGLDLPLSTILPP